jgi:hypothetical protein
VKVFEVEIHCDGLTVKAPGVSETEVKKQLLYFASDSIDAVWQHVQEQCLLQDEELKAALRRGELSIATNVARARVG